MSKLPFFLTGTADIFLIAFLFLISINLALKSKRPFFLEASHERFLQKKIISYSLFIILGKIITSYKHTHASLFLRADKFFPNCHFEI